MIKRTLLLLTHSILLVISASAQSEAATPLRLKIISNIGHVWEPNNSLPSTNNLQFVGNRYLFVSGPSVSLMWPAGPENWQEARIGIGGIANLGSVPSQQFQLLGVNNQLQLEGEYQAHLMFRPAEKVARPYLGFLVGLGAYRSSAKSVRETFTPQFGYRTERIKTVVNFHYGFLGFAPGVMIDLGRRWFLTAELPVPFLFWGWQRSFSRVEGDDEKQDKTSDTTVDIQLSKVLNLEIGVGARF